MGGLATALVAALVAVVGVVIVRGLFHVPVLAPTGEGTVGDASTARLAALVAVLAPFTTGADLDTKVATAAINLAIGLAIASLVPGVARSAIRLGSSRPPPAGSSPA
jgi:hypothetical protein